MNPYQYGTIFVLHPLLLQDFARCDLWSAGMTLWTILRRTATATTAEDVWLRKYEDPLQEYFDWTPTVEEVADIVVRLVCFCGTGLCVI